MKKLLLMLSILLWTVSVWAVVSWNQMSFQFFNDDGSLAGSSPYASEKTNITAYNSYLRIRLRIQDLDNGAAFTSTFKLQYNIDGGAFSDCPTTLSGNYLAVAVSPYFANGSATGQRLSTPTGGTTFVNGYGENISNITPNTTAALHQFTENEWCLIFGYLARGHTFTFHAVPVQGGPSYVSVPSITIVGDNNFTSGT